METIKKRVLVFCFSAFFNLSAVLCLAAGLLVTASLCTADNSPHTAQVWSISLIVSVVFFALGTLLWAIKSQLVQIAHLAVGRTQQNGIALERRVVRLLFLLSVGALGLCASLAILTYAILVRIDQGFAVFG